MRRHLLWSVGAIAVLVGCAGRAPRFDAGAGLRELDAFLAGHVPAPDQEIRVDEVGRNATASYHLVQVRGSERPHLHAAHDLSVFVLRGQGTLMRAGTAIPLSAGDAAVIPRGVTHWFRRDGRAPAIALVMFSPPLDGRDQVPVPGD